MIGAVKIISDKGLAAKRNKMMALDEWHQDKLKL